MAIPVRGMPCPYCQEEIDWGLARCPHCGRKLDISYLADDPPKHAEPRKKRMLWFPGNDRVNWVGMAGVVMAAVGICTIIFTLFSSMHFPAVEKAWPSFLLLFGLWALYARRKALRPALFIPLGVGFLFRGLQISLSSEEWSEISFVWPGILFITGFVWVFVASPEWRKENWKDFWHWPRVHNKDGK